MIQKTALILWDLDRTLSDPETFGNKFLDPIVDVCIWEQYGLTRGQVVEGLWKWSFFDAIRELSIPENVAEQMLNAHRTLAVPKSARAYNDVHQFFEKVRKAHPGVEHRLVTKGFVGYQNNKIDALDLRRFFTSVRVVDIETGETKLGVFEQILAEGYKAQEVVVIGDSADELTAGKKLGCFTIQTLRPSVEKVLVADAHIYTLEEIFSIPGR